MPWKGTSHSTVRWERRGGRGGEERGVEGKGGVDRGVEGGGRRGRGEERELRGREGRIGELREKGGEGVWRGRGRGAEERELMGREGRIRELRGKGGEGVWRARGGEGEGRRGRMQGCVKGREEARVCGVEGRGETFKKGLGGERGGQRRWEDRRGGVE